MTHKLIFLDKTLTLFFANLLPHNHLFDLIFSFFSLQGAAFFIWMIIAFFAIFLEERKNPGISRRDKRFIVSFLLSLLTTGILVNFVLKNLIHRPRPLISTNFNELQRIATNPCPSDFSFPSGHASLSFAAATVLAAFDRKRKRFYYFIAALISYSRIYLGCHFFLDVFFGAILGYILSKTFLKLLTPTP